MKILQDTDDKNINLNIELSFNPDLGQEECLDNFETETLHNIINPIENYETMRFIHEPYSGLIEQCDIWYYFYSYNNLPVPTHDGGLDYSLVGITEQENALMLKQFENGFFKLEFYKTANDIPPERTNRRLVFSKDLSIPNGERVFYTGFNDYIYVPVFIGSNHSNKENTYIYWFQDDTAISESILTGNTFFMTARFFNAKDGSVLNFSNNPKSTTDVINETEDMYFQVIIDRSNYTYQVFNYNGTIGSRIGQSGNPIKFYEISGG